MQIYNAMQLKAGKKAEYNRMGTLNQPIQFLPKAEKDNEWTAWNMDWLEWQGLKMVRRNARRLMKNYKLAKGIIDKTDYIVEEDNDSADLIDVLTKDDNYALELKFYPIIPNVINTLVSEFAKKNTQVTFRAVDDYSYNEQLELKQQQLMTALLSDAEQKVAVRLTEMGLDPNSQESKEALSEEKLMTLPEIESFHNKSYRAVCEEWATHQTNVDVERFRMDELEERGFRDMLITDREFWHFRMMEDDYDIELWNPVLTFYQKSPDVRYISQGFYVGKFDMMTVADAIDRYGWLMTREQQEAIELIYPVRSAGYPIQGYQNDGSYYDATKSHDWNTNMPSLAYRQFTSMWDNAQWGGDIVNWIMSDSEDYYDMGMTNLLRVTTCYWKTQTMYGHLTKVDEFGNRTMSIVTEDYKITDKPIYNTRLIKNKSADNLVFGEHIDWIWINQTYGGVKIGPNRPTFWGTNNPGGINPIYLGINQNNIGPLKYQFKGDSTLYGCKLPVEGAVFSDRNTRSTAMVDLMKPYQIGFNLVNNQVADILMDELGTVIVLDQNALPKHSLGEDWGKNNFAKAYVAMKDFQMLPLDTSLSNTENPLNFQHFQKLDLDQTNRLMSRVSLANYFKQQAFEAIGVSPQRMGQEIERQTATGLKMALGSSYSQTEVYFIQHCDNLMPRVHQMRTDLAQYYQSNKPSVRLSYITTSEQRKNFEINGTDLLLRDLNVFANTKTNQRAVMEELKQLALSNNTSGASIYDLGKLIKADSIAEIDKVLKDTEEKTQRMRQEEMAAAEKMQRDKLDAEAKEKAIAREFEADQNQKDRESDILQRKIQAAGYGAMQDTNANSQNDYLDALDRIERSDEYQQTMSLDQQKASNDMTKHQDKMRMEERKLDVELAKSDNTVKVAEKNKNKYDVKAKSKPAPKKKK